MWTTIRFKVFRICSTENNKAARGDNSIQSLNIQVQEYKYNKHHRISSNHNSPHYNKNDYD